MQLDRIEAIVRPRNPWESLDLGFSMVRRWWKPLYKVWFVLVLPIFVTIYLLFSFFEGSLWLALLMTWWWLKPLYDRILLHFLSHALFGEQPSIRQTLKVLPRLLFNTHLFSALTLRRFDFTRSFKLPVWQLEGSQARVAYQRLKMLQKNTRSTAIWLTIVCMHFEWVLLLSLFGLVYLMMPITYTFDLFYALIHEQALWAEILRMISTLLALSVVEPLYVAGGFALYLNRRTHLEGWDIDLAFRRIATHFSFNDQYHSG
ncbi:MAG TPA: hypothetical protein ENG03_06320 [Thioploca sp.]|nr:MAG: hypothetical protein B6247_27420 [Beggiatoa sp. 4572_84]RKZ55900.1 MAG: hypothetical protein DRR08_23065 [Gammaproteobacteria bacterium]HDN26700.1 hypothetical protein [Thioploca sp.]